MLLFSFRRAVWLRRMSWKRNPFYLIGFIAPSTAREGWRFLEFAFSSEDATDIFLSASDSEDAMTRRASLDSETVGATYSQLGRADSPRTRRRATGRQCAWLALRRAFGISASDWLDACAFVLALTLVLVRFSYRVVRRHLPLSLRDLANPRSPNNVVAAAAQKAPRACYNYFVCVAASSSVSRISSITTTRAEWF
jgi:hypothetical protein